MKQGSALQNSKQIKLSVTPYLSKDVTEGSGCLIRMLIYFLLEVPSDKSPPELCLSSTLCLTLLIVDFKK